MTVLPLKFFTGAATLLSIGSGYLSISKIAILYKIHNILLGSTSMWRRMLRDRGMRSRAWRANFKKVELCLLLSSSCQR